MPGHQEFEVADSWLFLVWLLGDLHSPPCPRARPWAVSSSTELGRQVSRLGRTLELVSCSFSTLQLGPRANRHNRRNPMVWVIVEVNGGN